MVQRLVGDPYQQQSCLHVQCFARPAAGQCLSTQTHTRTPHHPPHLAACRLINKAEQELAATEEKEQKAAERKQALEAAFGTASKGSQKKAADTLKERARMRKVLDKVRRGWGALGRWAWREQWATGCRLVVVRAQSAVGQQGQGWLASALHSRVWGVVCKLPFLITAALPHFTPLRSRWGWCASAPGPRPSRARATCRSGPSTPHPTSSQVRWGSAGGSAGGGPPAAGTCCGFGMSHGCCPVSERTAVNLLPPNLAVLATCAPAEPTTVPCHACPALQATCWPPTSPPAPATCSSPSTSGSRRARCGLAVGGSLGMLHRIELKGSGPARRCRHIALPGPSASRPAVDTCMLHPCCRPPSRWRSR